MLSVKSAVWRFLWRSLQMSKSLQENVTEICWREEPTPRNRIRTGIFRAMKRLFPDINRINASRIFKNAGGNSRSQQPWLFGTVQGIASLHKSRQLPLPDWDKARQVIASNITQRLNIARGKGSLHGLIQPSRFFISVSSDGRIQRHAIDDVVGACPSVHLGQPVATCCLLWRCGGLLSQRKDLPIDIIGATSNSKQLLLCSKSLLVGDVIQKSQAAALTFFL